MARPKLILFSWSAETVQREIGVKRDTFLRYAAEHELKPDANGKYTSKQVFKALTGNLRQYLLQERLNVLQEQAHKLKLENGRAEGKLLDADEVFQQYAGIFIVIRETIRASDMPEHDKAQLLAELKHQVLTAPPIEKDIKQPAEEATV